MARVSVGRFAPSATGRAHPGTWLAALLAWLDARQRGGRIVLRLEDLDPQRCTPAWVVGLRDDLDWFGLEWDLVERQSEHGERCAVALDRLAERGLLYPCSCSRSQLKKVAKRTPDGSLVYPGTCRGRTLPAGGWRACDEALRCRLPPGEVRLVDELEQVHDCAVASTFGDPVLRRRDGASAYHLAAVVDDAAIGVTDIVRGRDLFWSTATQRLLQELLDLPRPTYRHHLLLLEAQGDKFAKFHQAVGGATIRRHYRAADFCGLLAWVAGLLPEARACRPADLVEEFDWRRVHKVDQRLAWTGDALRYCGPA